MLADGQVLDGRVALHDQGLQRVLFVAHQPRPHLAELLVIAPPTLLAVVQVQVQLEQVATHSEDVASLLVQLSGASSMAGEPLSCTCLSHLCCWPALTSWWSPVIRSSSGQQDTRSIYCTCEALRPCAF